MRICFVGQLGVGPDGMISERGEPGGSVCGVIRCVKRLFVAWPGRGLNAKTNEATCRQLRAELCAGIARRP